MLPIQIKIALIPLVLSICAIGALHGQNDRIEELEALLLEVHTDTATIDLWNELSYEFYPVDIRENIRYSELALQIAREIGYKRGIAQALNHRAIGYGAANNQQKSLELNQESLTMAQELGDSALIGCVLNDLGVSYSTLNLPQQALELHVEAIPYLAPLWNAKQVYNLENIAYLYAILGDQDMADFYNEQVEAVAAIVKDHHIAYYPDYFQGYHYEYANQLDSAILYYHKALDKATTAYARSFLHECISYALAWQENYDLAKHHSLLAIEYLEQSGNRDGLLTGITYYCDILLENEEYEECLHVLHGYLKGDLADYRNFIDLEYAYYLEGEAYMALGQHELASGSLQQQVAIKDSLRQQEQADIVAALETRYELRKIEEENQILREQQAQSEVILEQQTRMNLVMGLSLLLLLIVLGLLYRGFRTNQRFSIRLRDEIDAKTAKLQAANTELKLSNAELERFAYITSHDLREPLRNISGFSTLIKRKLDVPGENLPAIQEYLNFIRNNTIQMDMLIRDILEYSRLENIKTVPQRTAISGVITNVKQAVQVTIEQRKVSIIVEELPVIDTFPQHIFLIFKNLIENGIKYNKSEHPTIRISYEQKDNQHFFCVHDNGIGIDDEFKEQIFDLFNRLHSRHDYEGTGIGLATCKKILTKLNGKIWVSESSSQGSVFCFCLPIITQEQFQTTAEMEEFL